MPASQFKYTDQTVTAGRNYTYYISALNPLGGESLYSTGVPVIPVSVPTETSAPTLVNQGTDFITMEWLSPSFDGGTPVIKYALYVKAEYDSAF